MNRVFLVAAVLVYPVSGLIAPPQSHAGEKPVVEEILDVLRQKEVISDQQYEQLRKKADRKSVV